MTGTTDPDAEYRPDADGKSVQKLFSRISGVYDGLNRTLSFGLDAFWRKKLAESVLPLPGKGSGRFLDMAAGTLESSLALLKRYPHHGVIALDFCRPMLARGLPKLGRVKNLKSLAVTADATALPLPDACVDAVTIAFGLRNIRPRTGVYAEALRVLVPGGRFCCLEFGSAEDRIMLGLYNLYLLRVLPAVGRMVSRDKSAYRYLAETVVNYPSALALEEEMRIAGFIRVRHKRFTAGIVCLHSGEKPMPLP